MNLRGIGQSATLAINERSKALRREGRKIYGMGLGQSPFPIPQSVVDSLKMHAHEKDYLHVQGLPALRTAVAEFHIRKDMVDIHPDNVLIGPGSKELMFLLQLVFYGEILLPSPSWVSYHPQAHILGRPVKFIHTTFENKWRLTARQLFETCAADRNDHRPRLIILNYPSNPDGGSYTSEELEEIAHIARQFNIILLSDEIYGQLHFAGEHVSVARFYPEGTIISSGLSKWCGAGGWRLGTFSFPPHLKWILEAMAAAASETYTSVSAPIQYAAIRAFKCGINIERYLWRVRKILQRLAEDCVAILQAGGIRVHMPDGAFYLFIDCGPMQEQLAARNILNSRDMCEQLLQDTGVAILPGSAFNRPAFELTARIATVNFDGAKALAKCETIPLDQPLPDNFTEMYCKEVLEGMRRLVKWVVQ